MGCCQSTRHDEVWISEHLRIRWPRLATAAEIQAAIRYGVGKTQEAMGPMPGHMKREVCATIVDLLVKEVATPELRELYEQMGGRAYVETSIDLLCSAKWRSKTKGV